MEEGWTDARSVYRRARQCSAQGQGPTHPSGGHGRAQALRESLSEAIHGGLRNRDLCNCHLNRRRNDTCCIHAFEAGAPIQR